MKLVALAGGVGGAKLAHGLAQILPPENLTIIVNTGDDFEHYGLYICPDLDTVCYTLAGLANPETGWGRANETWSVIENASRLGGPNWFRLGDQDLGTHLERTRRLKEGQTLTQITEDFCRAWAIKHTVLPMSNQPVRTIVETDVGNGDGITRGRGHDCAFVLSLLRKDWRIQRLVGIQRDQAYWRGLVSSSIAADQDLIYGQVAVTVQCL